ncbi:MAG: YidC/Oxa1 family membrane protein insertase [Chloroflexi bacterium]|nr:MAG: YidC/Oxa1 family membrane protein insertase [Chloroflexota bacterium]
MWDSLIINPMINTLLVIYNLVGGNFGIAIIVFTILIRLILYPLTVKQLKGTQGMQDLQQSKEWQEAQKKYKGDREQLQREQLRLYKEFGVNPMASCLPTLLQFPIMIGLYQAVIRALSVTPIQLLDLSKHIYPFVPAAAMIPLNNRFLWMDLSQPERLMIAGVGIPVLAILVVVTTYLQSKLMQPPSSNPNDQSAQMARTMNLTMPLFMGYIAYIYSSGLALYFLVGNLLYIAQYAIMGRLNWKNLLPQKKAVPVQNSPVQNSPALKKPVKAGEKKKK